MLKSFLRLRGLLEKWLVTQFSCHRRTRHARARGRLQGDQPNLSRTFRRASLSAGLTRLPGLNHFDDTSDRLLIFG